ncbi:hypothetical protein KSS87_012224 [Heliosperma pusillum]|nr:hypothetical protein KSS87_012224 [Heliosperma pusillum]
MVYHLCYFRYIIFRQNFDILRLLTQKLEHCANCTRYISYYQAQIQLCYFKCYFCNFSYKICYYFKWGICYYSMISITHLSF